MSNVILSTGVRQNLNALQSIKGGETTAQSRLATGKRVNSALDNPVNYFTSAALSDRATDLSNLLDGISNSVQTLQAATKGIDSLTNLVKSAQSAAKQALQTVDTASDAVITGGNSTVYTRSTSLTTTAGFSSGDKITMTVGNATTGTTAITFTVGTSSNSTIGDLMSALNSSNLGLNATINTSGQLNIEQTGGMDLKIDTADAASGGTAKSSSTGMNALFDTGVTAASATSASTTKAATTSTSRQAYATQFNDIMTQIDQMAKDSGYNGINLLMGNSLKTTFNEKTGKDQSSMTINGVSFDSQGLGLDTIASGGFQTNGQVNKVLDKLTTALSTLRTQASTFGSNLSVVQTRKDFTNNLVDTLNTGSDNLVAADTNQESANLLALQTRQQLSTKALSLANQADQSVLSLF
jgi:flagellin-like hook-associated protein FlgL